MSVLSKSIKNNKNILLQIFIFLQLKKISVYTCILHGHVFIMLGFYVFERSSSTAIKVNISNKNVSFVKCVTCIVHTDYYNITPEG